MQDSLLERLSRIEPPRFFHMTRQGPEDAIEDPSEAASRAVSEGLATFSWKPGQRIAVGVGSRGIRDIDRIAAAACKTLKEGGLSPFIVPAMGSHGGATADGQRAVLASLGVDPQTCGVDFHCSMETTPIATAAERVPVQFSREALEADHCMCINRIKAHTKFKGTLESGLTKMLAVGLGKHAGAQSYHSWAMQYGFDTLLREMGARILEKSNFRFGIAVVENERDRPVLVEAVAAKRLADREPELLEYAKSRLARIDFREVDVLLIQQIGKEISGAGMDPNITGRAWDLGETGFDQVRGAKRIALLGLSTATAGNGLGLGFADVITESLYQALDYDKTLVNAFTSLSLRKAAIPVRMPNDRLALQACLATLGPVKPHQARVLVIRDTLHLYDFLASEALRPEADSLAGGRIRDYGALKFDKRQRLQLPW